MLANVARFKCIALVLAISFSQMACSWEIELEPDVKNAVVGAANELKGAARAFRFASSDFRFFLPIVVVILVAQVLLAILSLITRWRIMRSIAKLNLHLSSTPDDQSSSGP